jgi:hypothetical protein
MLFLRFKRILYMFLECLVFVLGLFASVILAAVVDRSFNFSPALPFLFGLAVTLISFFYLRRKILPFKLEYEAARFLEERRLNALHPRRAIFFRFARHCLLWIPSAWALFVLLWFPQVTHLFHPRAEMGDSVIRPWIFLPKLHNLSHPGSEHLLRNQIHIPWNWTILNTFDAPGRFSSVYIIIDHRAPWPFGGKYRPNQGAHLSAVTISSLSLNEVVDRQQHASHWSQIEKAEHSSRIIEANGITLACSGYLSPWSTNMWVIHCETSSSLRPRNLDAAFVGPAEDLPTFYELLQTARPAN